MTAKPDDFADWATDTNFTNGPDVGTATKVVPSAGEIAEGHIRETAPSAQKENWWKYIVGQWTHYFDEQLIALHVQVDQQPALNFSPVTISNEAFHAFFNPVSNSWLLCYLNETVLETPDWGGNISASVVASAGAGENSIHGNSDPDGNWVIATTSRYVFERTQSSLTVTKVDVHGGAATFDEALVVFDSVRDKWVWWAREGGAVYLETSTDRTTWTLATDPTFSTDTSFAKAMVANPTTGRILFITRNSSPNRLYILRTDDAGTTWTSTTYVTLTSWTPDAVSLAYNEVDGAWLLAASSTGDSICKVWRSTDDGVSWTEVTSLTATFITSVSAYGDLWVACAKGFHADANTYDLLWSTDGGTTWTRAGMQARYAVRVYYGAGGFVLPAEDRVFFGHRMHAPALGVAT
jgi:hypothetical protein